MDIKNENQQKYATHGSTVTFGKQQTHAYPLTAETVPVFVGKVESTGTTTSDVRLPQAHATLRVQRSAGNDGPALTYRRRLRFILDEKCEQIVRIHDERGYQVSLSDFGSHETPDHRVVTLDVISEQPNPLYTAEEDHDGTWYHPVGGMEATFVPKGEDPDKYL
jgi:hypothetical protein